MKKILMGMSLSALTLSSAWAAVENPLLSKSTFSGFTPPEWTRYERCDLYTDKVIIHRRFGADLNEKGFEVSEVRKITTSPGLLKVVKEAQAEKVKESPNSLCDGPTTVIKALPQAEASNSDTGFLLFHTGGCGSPSIQREGAATQMLIDLINNYCPKTETAGVED